MIEPTDEMVTAAAEVIEEECVRRRGHDLGTIHRDDIVRAGLAPVLALVERQAEAEQQVRVEAERNEIRARLAATGRKGYETAIAVLRDVADRTGSPAAAWCADYLLADPDRLAPPPQ